MKRDHLNFLRKWKDDPIRVPFIPGKTLLFHDEIQECPHALRYLRYFKEKCPDLHVIAAGSLLEFTLKNYEVAAVFSKVTGKKFLADALPPEQFINDLGLDRMCIDPYFIGVEECFKQIVDGRMVYMADVRDDLPSLIGRKGMTLEEWVTLHKEAIL